MDKRVSKLFRKNLFERVQGIAAFGVVMCMFYGFNKLAINAGWFIVPNDDSAVALAIALSFFEIMLLGMTYWLIRDSYDDAKRAIAQQDYQKEIDEKYGSTAK